MDDNDTLNINSINPTRDNSDDQIVEPEASSDVFEIPKVDDKPAEVISPPAPASTQLPNDAEVISEPTPETLEQAQVEPQTDSGLITHTNTEASDQANTEPVDISAARAQIAKTDDPFTTQSAHPVTQQPLPALMAAGNTTAAAGVGVTHTPYQINLPTKWMKPILGALGIFLLVLTLFETPVIYHQIQFLLNKSNSQTTANTATTAIGAESVIDIPKINVHAPVVYEASTAEANIQHALENGVVHYATTAVPGQAGNDVIVGHSSNDWWEPGNYKFVFVLLDKLIPGDTFSINYQSERYVYKVTSSQVVAPTDVAVLRPTANPTVTLITCTPPGSPPFCLYCPHSRSKPVAV